MEREIVLIDLLLSNSIFNFFVLHESVLDWCLCVCVNMRGKNLITHSPKPS